MGPHMNEQLDDTQKSNQGLIQTQNSEAKDPNEIKPHDFERKKYPTTYKSIFNCTINFLIAIPTILFHLPIILVSCVICALIPLPTMFRRCLQRNLKVYIEQVLNTVLGLWFKKTFYVAVDSRLLDLIDDCNKKNRFPKILTISNHISEVDWLFMKLMAERLNFLRYTYIVMKQALSEIPILGFILRSLGHTFVVREKSNPDKVKDQSKENRDTNKVSKDSLAIKSFARNLRGNFEESSGTFSEFWKKVSNFLVKIRLVPRSPGANGLYFPEGTIFYKKSYENMLEFHKKAAEKSETAQTTESFKPEYVLLPRPLGTSVLLAELSDFLDCICDTTLFTMPFVPSTFDCISFADIFLCKAPAFTFCMKMDRLDIPEDIKNHIKKLEETCFERPDALTDQEKLVKNRVSEFLYEAFKKKNDLIKNYVEEYNGEFQSEDEFSKFIEENSKNETPGFNMQTMPIKIESPYKSMIFFAPVLFFSFLICYYFRKAEFLKLLFTKKAVSAIILE